MKIVILDGYTVVQDDLNWDELKEFGELHYYERTPEDEVIQRIGEADMVITSKCIIDNKVMDSAPHLKYIGVIATGYNNVDIEYAHKKGITVTNIPSYSTDSVAQFTFSLLLEVVNHIGMHNDSVHRGNWEKSVDFCYTLSPQTELAGKTFGIMGYGNIGKRVAALARAFAMKVLVCSSHMEKTFSDDGISFVSFEELLECSDVLSLHCALTDDNEGMIDKKSISRMKKNAILINTSRGPLINESDLADALKTNRIKAAALDVLTKEPPVDGNPLTGLSNCIITPHIAWITREARQRLIDITVKNVRFFLAGKTINNV